MDRIPIPKLPIYYQMPVSLSTPIRLERSTPALGPDSRLGAVTGQNDRVPGEGKQLGLDAVHQLVIAGVRKA